MAEEFQTGVCGGNWWLSTSRSPFAGSTSPCSVALNDTGGYAWSDMVDMKGRSTACEETNSVSDRNSMVFQDAQKPQQADSASTGSSSILIDSTLQMMGFGFSSPSTTSSDWNQALLRGSGRAESNYNSMMHEDMNSRLNYQQERGLDSSQIQKNWSPKNFSSGGDQDLSITAAFKSINQDFSLDTVSSSGNCTVTCQGLSAGFPVGSTPYGYPSTVLQSLFDHPDSQPQQSLFNNQSMNYSSTANYGTNTNIDQLLPSWPKFSPSMSKQQQQPLPWGLHFSNKTPFWNASTAALSDNARAGIFSSSQPQYLLPTFEEKPKCSNLPTKPNIDDVQDSVSVVKKSNSEPVFKRPRIETPSPLPTFKVRKEKLGDRITALQQLVSPFGKTDTASVLHEAIEYIKFLHEQVSVLTNPYMKNGTTPIQHQQGSDKHQQDTEGAKQDLRSRGLCLAPIASTYPVANETPADFWTPTFGGTFR